jgi:Icc-related predicted phosphoesterase
MKIQIISDIHLEFRSRNHYKLPKTNADILVIAGDLGPPRCALKFIEEMLDRGHIVLYVLGNHEFYISDKIVNKPKNRLINTMSKIRDFWQEKHNNKEVYKNLHVLDNEYVDIDGVRFIGSTLWADIRTIFFLAMNNMNDFRLIPEFGPEREIELFDENKEWLQKTLNNSSDRKCVVITHHLPSEQCIVEQYKDSPLNRAYYSDLDYLMDGENLLLWIHGHTHKESDKIIYGTRVICNPLGYPDERNKVLPKLVVEI